MRVGIVVGEPSGDKLAAAVIKELSARVPCKISGILGPELKKYNPSPIFDMQDICVMGFIEPLKILPKLIKIKKKTIKYFLDNPPDLFIGVDAPDFNLGIERQLKKNNIKVIHYVSPSVWAWRQSRVHYIKKCVDLILVLFPFEEKFYSKYNVPVEFVGHPFADKIKVTKKKINKNILILPGSRKKELHNMLPIFLKIAKNVNLPVTIAVLSREDEKIVKQYLTFDAKIVVNDSYSAMAACDIALVTSGTATLELMLHNKPMVIGYKTNFFLYHILKLIIKTKYIGLPNILAEKMIVPEFIHYNLDVKIMTNSVFEMLNKNLNFETINSSLRKNSATTAVNAILKLLEVKNVNSRSR